MRKQLRTTQLKTMYPNTMVPTTLASVRACREQSGNAQPASMRNGNNVDFDSAQSTGVLCNFKDQGRGQRLLTHPCLPSLGGNYDLGVSESPSPPTATIVEGVRVQRSPRATNCEGVSALNPPRDPFPSGEGRQGVG